MFEECILEYSKFNVGGPQAIRKKDRVLTTAECEIDDQYYNKFIDLNTNWDFSNFTINKDLTNSEDDATVNFVVTINNNKFTGRCHLYDFLRQDTTIIVVDTSKIINLTEYMDNVDRNEIGRAHV